MLFYCVLVPSGKKLLARAVAFIGHIVVSLAALTAVTSAWSILSGVEVYQANLLGNVRVESDLWRLAHSQIRQYVPIRYLLMGALLER